MLSFRPSPQTVFRAAELTLVALGCGLLAATVNVFAAAWLRATPAPMPTEPAPTAGAPAVDDASQKKVVQFGYAFGIDDPTPEPKSPAGGPAVSGPMPTDDLDDEGPAIPPPPPGTKCEKADFGYALAGTLYSSDPRQSSATVRTANADESRTLWVGQEFSEGDKLIRVAEIKTDKVVFESAGRRLCLGFTEDMEKEAVATAPTEDDALAKYTGRAKDRAKHWVGKIRSDGTGRYTLDADFMDQTMGNLSTVMMHGRFEPYAGKEGAGFLLKRAWEGGVFEGMGMQSGDVLRAVNGKPVTNIEEAVSLFGALRDNRNFAFELTRGGKPVKLTYDVR
jgi:general secretion pathway protein C